MTRDYFGRVHRETPTRMWVNNPSGTDMEKAIAAGAINCTTNPQYCQKLLESDPEYIRGVIDSVIPEVGDDDVAAERIYHKAALRVIERFRPLYEASGGTQGFVTIQGDPRKDEDADAIVNEALRGTRLGPNFMAKIPVTEAGAAAIEALVARDVPLCATEIFGLAQAIYICEKYQQAAKKSGKHPPFFVTHISGIFDEYLGRYVKSENVNISPDVLWHAGCAVARAEYRLLKRREYPGIMLGGGARGVHHFTEMVGGDVHVTINYREIEALLQADGPVVNRMDFEVPQSILDELSAKLPDFRRAFAEDGLAPAEFKGFGPLQLFRNNFVGGYERLLQEIAVRRSQARVATS